MSKATEIKIDNKVGEGSGDRRRGIRLVPPPGIAKVRPGFNIGIASNVFLAHPPSQQIGIDQSPVESESDAEAIEPVREEGRRTALGTAVAVGGIFLIGLLGYAIGRRRR